MCSVYVYTCDKHTRATSTCAVCTNTASPWRAGCAERKRERGVERGTEGGASLKNQPPRSGDKGARDVKERERERERRAGPTWTEGGEKEKEKER